MVTNNSICPIDENLIEGCDEKSAIYCSMFNALQTILTPEGQNVLKNNNIERMAYSDLSALGLYIGKYVEQEINSSIVQLMRRIVGIEMPEFYCKRDCSFPIHEDEVYTGKTTRLNERMPGSDNFSTLKPIPLGDAYYACMQLGNEDRSQFDGYEWIFEYRFKDIWRNLFSCSSRRRSTMSCWRMVILMAAMETSNAWYVSSMTMTGSNCCIAKSDKLNTIIRNATGIPDFF